MAIHPNAGKPAPPELLIDVAELNRAYHEKQPDLESQLVSFGTSGHRGTSLAGTFQEAHILAITQAICDYRAAEEIVGPLFMGMDSHALSAAAQATALEVLSANSVHTVVQSGGGLTPTPVISHAILTYNEDGGRHQADGIVMTPSHNPPADGGFKYNPPNGGPADTSVTGWIQERANHLLGNGNREVKRSGRPGPTIQEKDLVHQYVDDLNSVVDMDVIQRSGLKIGVDPLGGASLPYWAPIAEKYRLNLTVVNQKIDPTFRFMTVDHDGKIRMDCSSPYAMAGLVGLKDEFDIAFGNDPDADRHGIVTKSLGLLNPNHYLAVAIDYLLKHRPRWPRDSKVGKTLVSSCLIDRVVEELGRCVYEVPVGFKWFTPGLFEGTVCFGGEESAGASFLRRNGRVWSTDKDGLILGLLAAEMTARRGHDPGERYNEMVREFGATFYRRIDQPASKPELAALKELRPELVTQNELAGHPILAKLIRAPGNGSPIGGLKVVTAAGWFAARPSGTEDIYKLYAESTVSETHLEDLIGEAKRLVGAAIPR